MSYSYTMKPVALPPGRERLSTKSPPTGSTTLTNWIGTFLVACSNGLAADGPAQLHQRLMERSDAGLKFHIIRSCGQNYSDPPHSLGLLRPRRERPCSRTAEQRDEIAPS